MNNTLNFDDYRADTYTSGSLAIGGSISGSIETFSDNDWFSVYLTSGNTYQFDATENDYYLDLEMYLRNSYGYYLAYGDDFGGTDDPRIIYTPSYTGYYYLDVSDYWGIYTGSYVVEASVSDDFSSNIYTSGSVSIGSSSSGNIESAGDSDWFKVYLTSGNTYQFDATESNNLDLDMFLRDSNGISLAYGDDYGGTDDPRITYTATYTGYYYLDVADYWLTSTGQYTVEAKSLIVDDFSSDFNTTGSITLDGSIIGNIETAGDTDWFKVYLTSGNTYQFDATESNNLDLDMFLRDSNGISLAYGDDYGGTDDPRITYTATYTGYYYLDVADYWLTSTGQYTVEAKQLNIDDYSASIYTTGNVSIDGSISAGLDFVGDRDWFAISLIQGYTYQFDCTESGSIDPYLYLRDSLGNSIIYDDDGGSDGDDARIIYTANTTGTYYLDVGDYGDNNIGQYLISAKSLTALDDYDSNINTSGIISIGSSINANIDFISDYDWFKVSLIQGYTYQFDCTDSGSIDPYLYLRDSQGNIITYDDDGGSDIDDSQISYTASYTGNYFLDVSDYSDSNIGGYNLSAILLTIQDDYQASINTLGTISVGGQVAAELDFNSDSDWFKVSLVQGQNYQFDCIDYNLIDPYLYLRDSQGNIITYDDDSGSGDDSRIIYTATSTGNYFLDVSDYGDNNIGEYTLKAALLNSDDYSSDINTTGVIPLGSEASAYLDFFADSDWFKVSLVQGHTYQFDCIDSGVIDPYLYLRNSQGNIITYDNDSGSGDNSRIIYTATSTGNYFLDVSDYDDNDIGYYTVKAKLLNTDDYSADINTIGSISLGGNTSGKIDYLSDRDWFKVSLVQGQNYQFDCTESNSLDTYMYLLDNQGNYIDYNDDGGSDYDDPRITFTANTTGIYFLDIGDYGDNNTGEYHVHFSSITNTDDFSDDVNTTGTISVGGKVTADLDFNSDHDWFSISLIQGTTYVFDAITFNSVDPFISLRDTQGNLLTSDNNSGNNNNAKITFTPGSTDTYFLDVSDVGNDNIGSYEVNTTTFFNSSVDDFSGDIFTNGNALLGGFVSANLDFSGDSDWFSITLQSGNRYQFDCIESNEIDSYLRIRDSNGVSLNYDNNGGSGDDSRLIFDATNTATYFLEVGDVGNNNTGLYQLYAQQISSSSATFSSQNGYGSVNAEHAFEQLLGVDLLSRPDFGGNSWNIDHIGAREVWMGTGGFSGVTGSGVTIAIIDTGIDTDHSEFAGRIVNPWDFVNNNSDVEDDNGHGTHVAGTAAAANNNIGVTGVAYDANIMPLDVFETYYDSNGVLRWGANPANTAAAIRYATDNGADVINLSLGGYSPSTQYFSALQYAEQNNVVCVMAAGNGGAANPAYPARYATDYGVAVGADSIYKAITDYSDKAGNTTLNYVTAPGGTFTTGIFSAWNDGAYNTIPGTSMASPHVAGVVALLRSYDSTLTVDEIKNLLTSTASNQSFTANVNQHITPLVINSSNILVEGTSQNDILSGGNDDNEINGGNGDDLITGNGGYDDINGGNGSDTVIYTGEFEDYSIVRIATFESGSNLSLNELEVIDNRSGSNDGIDSLENIEYLQFSDQLIEQSKVDIIKIYDGDFRDYKFYNLQDGTYQILTENGVDDITGMPTLQFTDQTISAISDIKGTFDQVTGTDDVSGKMFRLYNAAFKRFPDSDGLNYWISKNSSGENSERVIAESFLLSDEFKSLYGDSVTNQQYIETLYNNILGRLPDQSGLGYWMGQLNNGHETRYELLLGFAESTENKTLFSEMTGF